MEGGVFEEQLSRICQFLLLCHRIFTLYYNYSMSVKYCDPQNHTLSNKGKAETPTTADSNFSSELYEKSQQYGVYNQLATFWGNASQYETRNQMFLYQKDDKGGLPALKNKLICQKEEQVGEWDLKVHLLLSDNCNIIKELKKDVYKVIEGQKQMTLIFDRQHEKFDIREEKTYIIGLSFETRDGFSRKIWEKELGSLSNFSKNEILVLKNEDQSFKFNAEVEKRFTTALKPLCFRFSASVLQSFFETKFKLLNKNELLNSVQSLKDLQGLLYQLSQQNMGSRTIQKLLQKASAIEIEKVILELKPYLSHMIIDQYGNYIIPKLFKLSKPETQENFINFIQHDFCRLLKNKAGTYCLQACLNSLSRNSLSKVLSLIQSDLEQLCLDEHAHHFIIKISENSYAYTLAESILNKFERIYRNKYGTIVLKKIVLLGLKNSSVKGSVLQKCKENFNELAVDQYGHYFIVQLIKSYSFYELSPVFEHISLYPQFFARNQNSSNIIQKSLEQYRDYVSIPLINELCVHGLRQLMQSSAGSFVLHRILQLTSVSQHRNRLYQEMAYLAPELNSHEKRTKWCRFLNLE